jgi:hypothetical protein
MLVQGDEPQPTESGGTSSSGSGFTSLSDPLVVTAADKATPSSRRRVKAPVGSATMEIRRSSRVAKARSRPLLLPVVEEEPGQLRPPLVPLGNTGDFRDTPNPQMGSSASRTGQVGRKRSASSAAPGSAHRTRNPYIPASAADFSPDHFEEPNSDNLALLAPHESHQPDHAPTSPMKVDSTSTVVIRQSDTSPVSSTLSRNPLLATPAARVRPPSSRKQPSATVRTRDSNTAQAAMEGFFPIGEGFQAPGYAPVGGVTYQLHSPRMGRLGGSRAGDGSSAKGRELFPEYTSTVVAGPHDPPVETARHLPTPQVLLQHVCIHLSPTSRIY